MENPKYSLAKVYPLGEKLASLDLPPDVPFKSFKDWLEGQPGVVLVEENSQVRMMTTPQSPKKK